MKNDILNLENLEIFVLAAETKQFKLTAELSFKSASAVTIQIQKLEEQLGSKFFVRDKGNLKLTQNGKILYEYAKQMLY